MLVAVSDGETAAQSKLAAHVLPLHRFITLTMLFPYMQSGNT